MTIPPAPAQLYLASLSSGSQGMRQDGECERPRDPHSKGRDPPRAAPRDEPIIDYRPGEASGSDLMRGA